MTQENTVRFNGGSARSCLRLPRKDTTRVAQLVACLLRALYGTLTFLRILGHPDFGITHTVKARYGERALVYTRLVRKAEQALQSVTV